jgi:aspartate-semialdehyde dehydrogenase
VQQQTVGLLSFKPLQKDIYDAQVAFNLVASLGPSAKANLENTRDTIHRHAGILTGESAFDSLTLQLLQAPVFHGYTASIFLELSQKLDDETLRTLLLGDQSKFVEEDFPSNESAVGTGEILLRVSSANATQGSACWLWMAADNLRLSARNAAACALELLQLRPTPAIQ